MEQDKQKQTPSDSYFSGMDGWVAVDAFGTLAELIVEGVAVTVEVIGDVLSG
jgi:hypothetical protein